MIRSSNVLAAQLVSVILAQASEVMASSVLWVLWYSGVEALAASKSRGSNGFPAAWHA